MRMQFLTTVNVTAVKLFGTATRGEKIDLESYTFEGWKNTLLKVFTLIYTLKVGQSIFAKNQSQNQMRISRKKSTPVCICVWCVLTKKWSGFNCQIGSISEFKIEFCFHGFNFNV